MSFSIKHIDKRFDESKKMGGTSDLQDKSFEIFRNLYMMMENRTSIWEDRQYSRALKDITDMKIIILDTMTNYWKLSRSPDLKSAIAIHHFLLLHKKETTKSCFTKAKVRDDERENIIKIIENTDEEKAKFLSLVDELVEIFKILVKDILERYESSEEGRVENV